MSEAVSVRVELGDLAAFGRALLEAAGATAENAEIVMKHLLEADKMGLNSHGVIRIPQYLDDIAAGEIVPDAVPVLNQLAPGRTLVDGGRGFGMVVGLAMATEAIRLAHTNGVGFVAGRHLGHTGRIGSYPDAMARAGCLGIAVCSGPPSGHWVAPFGGRAGRLATNPIAYAYPVVGAEPVVGDFSTSVVPEGVIRSLRNRGLSAPEGALRDASGRPSSDPAALYGPPRGTIQPLGGALGYRGTALGILVEALATLLSGDAIDDPTREGSDLAMLAVAVDDGFAERAAGMSAYMRSSPPIDPACPVMMPGEREQNEAVRPDTGTILLDGPTWRSMVARAGSAIRVPEPVSDG
jgi:LDH2 family malate/lactate/ureidoglycolate dehydrogenase